MTEGSWSMPLPPDPAPPDCLDDYYPLCPACWMRHDAVPMRAKDTRDLDDGRRAIAYQCPDCGSEFVDHAGAYEPVDLQLPV